jgi:hypothetical protein
VLAKSVVIRVVLLSSEKATWSWNLIIQNFLQILKNYILVTKAVTASGNILSFDVSLI